MFFIYFCFLPHMTRIFYTHFVFYVFLYIYAFYLLLFSSLYYPTPSTFSLISWDGFYTLTYYYTLLVRKSLAKKPVVGILLFC